MQIRFDLRTVYLKARSMATDAAGCKYATYPSVTAAISANIQPAGGESQAKQYGEKLDSILNMFYSGSEAISVGDGLCVYVSSSESPDFKVKAIKNYSGHKEIVLEAI